MSLETVSEKRNRVYRRWFDHDEARRLRAEDPKTWSYPKLAAHFGVSEAAVQRICNARTAARVQRNSLESARRARKPCLDGCGRLVWMNAPGRSGLCWECWHAQQTAANEDIRPDALRCKVCGEWKLDEEFYRRSKAKARRGRVTLCKPCSNAARRDYRHRHREREAAYANRLWRQRRERNPMARFIVFQPNGHGFIEVDRVDAASAEHAIEKIAKEPGSYVAVTEGQFKVRKVAPIESLRVVHEETASA